MKIRSNLNCRRRQPDGLIKVARVPSYVCFASKTLCFNVARDVEAECLRGKAYIARHAGDFDQAVRLASSAIEIAPDLHFLRARCFNIIGLCRFMSAQDTNDATESWRSALDEARQAGDDRFARIVLHNLGLPYFMEGDVNEAIHWISQMIETHPSGIQEANPQEPGAPFPQ